MNADSLGGAADEVASKAALWNSSTVDARLGETFHGSERREAALLLARLVGDVPGGDEADSEEATCRLMLAALRVSGGNLRRLALWVEAALMDPRDLIAAAEYPAELQETGPEARLRDLAEYVAWVSGTLAHNSELPDVPH